MIDLRQFSPETLVIVAAVIGLFVGAAIGGIGIALFHSQNARRFYLRGCTDTEKLIRNQQVRDMRGSIH